MDVLIIHSMLGNTGCCGDQPDGKWDIFRVGKNKSRELSVVETH